MRVCEKCGLVFEDTVSSCAEPEHPALSIQRPGSCEMIEGYRLERLLNAGLAGETFLARHISSSKSCLASLMAPNTVVAEQFVDQALRAAKLNHANVSDVYAAGILDTGQLYLIEEQPVGQTLRDLLDKNSVPDRLSTIRIIRQVAEGLHAIHEKDLIHRAVCPENIFLSHDESGEVTARLGGIDFAGIAECAVFADRLDLDPMIGSLIYYSPEQCLSEKLTNKSDLYSLGVVLYEMLAGHPPFDATAAAALISMHENSPPPEIRIDDPTTGMLLLHTLAESLRKYPERREASALAFARQMRHIEQLAIHASESQHEKDSEVETHSDPVQTSVTGASAAAALAPAAVQIDPLEDDVPSIDDVLEVAASESLPVDAAAMRINAAEADAASSEMAATHPLAGISAAPRVSPNTLLNRTPSERSVRGTGSSLAKSGLLIAAGAGGMLLFVLLSSMFIGMSDARVTTADLASTPAATPQAEPSPRQRAPKPPGPFAVTPLDQPVSDVDDETPLTPPRTNSQKATRTAARPEVTSAATNKLPRTKRIRGYVVSKFVPTTLVIYAEDGVVKSRVEPQPSIANKKTLSMRN